MNLTDPFILLHADDNVLVCRVHIFAGHAASIDGSLVNLVDEIIVGHKVARSDLKTGDKVLKYGVSVGSITADVTKGGHVHLHNMRSDYISSHTRKVVS